MSRRDCAKAVITAVAGCLAFLPSGPPALVKNTQKLSTFTGRRRAIMPPPRLLSNQSCLCFITRDA
jgi:hypothetical protein